MGNGRRVVVVGAGHNGLTAAVLLARAGWEVDVYERAAVAGGAARSVEVFGAGDIVDIGAAAHPFGVASPVFRELGLADHGLRWAHARYPMAHPLDSGPAAVLHRNLADTAADLGVDAGAWRRLHGHVVEHIDDHLENFLGPPLRLPPHPRKLMRFALPAVWPADALGRAVLRTGRARALLAGSAVHAVIPPSAPLTSAFGILFGALGMSRGWPVAAGGTQAVTDALLRAAGECGVRVHTGTPVRDMRDLPRADAHLLNLTPRQILDMPGVDLTPTVRRRFARWRYGAGVFKVDYLLSGPVPWRDPRVAEATTVHVGGSTAEIDHAERQARAGRLPARPFVMVCQQQVADPARSRLSYVLWTYAHVPHGYSEARPGEVAAAIEAQIERFAPGFREVVVDKRAMSPAQLEAFDPNLVGGDIAGGSMAGLRAVVRPGWTTEPYRIGDRTFMTGGATPPGAGVHGMAGAWAARAVMERLRA